MKKETVIYLVSAAIIGAIISGSLASYAVNTQNAQLLNSFGMTPHQAEPADTSHMTMADVNESLEQKNGDDFDELFLSSMILHHRGAVEMAEIAKTKAKHDEIKELSKAIIQAQKTEIDRMHTWEHEWGYKSQHATEAKTQEAHTDNRPH